VIPIVNFSIDLLTSALGRLDTDHNNEYLGSWGGEVMTLIGTACDRLRVQGYVHVDGQTLKAVEPWLRWSPAICTLFIALGTVLASPWILWGLVPFALAGAVMDRHPFDYLYNFGFRHLTRTPPLPPHGAPRRFACTLAAAWLAGTGALFALDLTTLGYVAGGVMTGMATLVSVTHFCVPSVIYGLLFSRQGHPNAAAAQRVGEAR
jgi:hypothetical protein